MFTSPSNRGILSWLRSGSLLAFLILLITALLVQLDLAGLPEPLLWHSPGLQKTVSDIRDRGRTIDLLVIGSSAAKSAFDEKIICPDSRCLNASFDGPSLKPIGVLLKTVFLTVSAPSKVVIGLTPNEFCLRSPQIMRTDGYFLNSLGLKAITGTGLERLTASIRVRVKMFSYSGNISKLLRGIPRGTISRDGVPAERQSDDVGRNLSVPDELIYGRLQWFGTTDEGFTILEDICKVLKEKNIVPTIALLPLSTKFVNTVGLTSIAEYKEKVHSISTRYKTEFIDLDNKLRLVQSDNFVDVIHFSEKGRSAISIAMQQELFPQ